MFFLRKKLFILTGVLLLCFCIINTPLASAEWNLRHITQSSDYDVYELSRDGSTVDFLNVEGSDHKLLSFSQHHDVYASYYFDNQMISIYASGQQDRNELGSLSEAINKTANAYINYYY